MIIVKTVTLIFAKNICATHLKYIFIFGIAFIDRLVYYIDISHIFALTLYSINTLSGGFLANDVKHEIKQPFAFKLRKNEEFRKRFFFTV